LTAVGLAAGLAGGYGLSREPPTPAPWLPRRLPLSLPKDARIWSAGGLAVAPSGDRIAYVAGTDDKPSVYIQELTAFEPRLVKGAEGGSFPVFSPDGRWLAFQSKGFFRRVPAEGGEAISICAAPPGSGLAWPREDLVLYSDPATGALMSAPVTGGAPETFLKIEAAVVLVEPDPLPDAKGVFLTIRAPTGDTVAVLDLATRRAKKILETPAAFAHYVPTGHVVYNATVQEREIGVAVPPERWVAAPFDLGRLEVTGAAVEVLADLRRDGYAAVWVTPHGSGILAYTAEPSSLPAPRTLEWIEADGRRTKVDIEGRDFVPYSVALSPDGQRLALAIRDGANFDLWVGELVRGTWLRLTADGQSQSPLWSPDGKRIAFASGREKKDLFWVAADGGAAPELLAKAGTVVLRPTSFSPDGGRLIFAKGTWDGPPRSVGVLLYTIPLEGAREREPRVLIDSPFPVSFGSYSPDGRWIAYVTLESGQAAVYLRAADLTGRRWALSKGNGQGPAWSPDGSEVFFQEAGRLKKVEVRATGPEGDRVVLESAFIEGNFAERSFELGKGRFLVWQPPPEPSSPSRPTRVVLVPDWFAELRKATQTVRR
jgi:Tol biopolymer transport system component